MRQQNHRRMFTSKYADSSRHVTSMSWNCDNDDNDYEQDADGDPVAAHSVPLMNPEMKQNCDHRNTGHPKSNHF